MSTWANRHPHPPYIESDGDLLPLRVEVTKSARGPFMDFTNLPIPSPRSDVAVTWCEPLEFFLAPDEY